MGRALLLAVVLVLGLPAGVAGLPASGPATQSADLADVSILTLNDSSRAKFATTSVDVATAQAVQYDAAAARLDRYALVERFRNTGSSEARKTLLFQAATDVEIRIATLRDEERAIREAYANRDVSTDEYVRQLARLHARVSNHRATLDRIQALADEIPQFSMRRRARLLDTSLHGFEGPIRDRSLGAIQGDRPPLRLFVAVSAEGLVLSTIEDGQFVREAYRADNRDTETVGGMSLNEAADRSAALYPVAYNTTNSIRTGINGLSGGLYRVEIELREGIITAYLDGATREVFFEIQERRLDLLGSRPAATGAANGTRLVVNRSYPGGPLQISVTDADTGTPFATTVIVEGDKFVTTPAGSLWTLAPAGPFEVTAVGPRGNVTISVRPLSPTPVTAQG